MTLQRARIIKAPITGVEPTELPETKPAAAAPNRAPGRGHRIPRAVLEGRAEAERIVADAHAKAAEVAAAAAREAREIEIAKLAAAFLELRREDERRAERDLDRAVQLAVVLAERLVGEALPIEPQRIANLAASALAEARGARRVRIDASPDDVDALRGVLGQLGYEAEVTADPALARGSLVVHTDLGRIDARLAPQLARLAAVIRKELA